MTVIQRLTLLWRRYSPLEQSLLQAVRGALPPAVQPIFDAQVAAVSRVQRHPHWTEIVFYRLRRGKVDWTDVPTMPRVDEFPLAEVRFQAAGRSYKARLTAIKGHICDFAITPSPRDVAFAAWESEAQVRLLSDPLDVTAPPSVEPLPEAWRRFLDENSHTDVGRWVLYGATDTYRVALDEGEFLVLAEREGDSFLLYRLEPSPRDYFVLYGHDGSPEPMRGGFADVIRSA
jgi:hypothetical protein